MELFVAANGQDAILRFDPKGTYQGLVSLVREKFHFDKGKAIRIKKLHPVSKKSYSFDELSFLRDGDELEAEIIDDWAERESKSNADLGKVEFFSRKDEKNKTTETKGETQDDAAGDSNTFNIFRHDDLKENLNLIGKPTENKTSLDGFMDILARDENRDHNALAPAFVSWCSSNGFPAKIECLKMKRNDGSVVSSFQCKIPFCMFKVSFVTSFGVLKLQDICELHTHKLKK
jgi:hypothetical protein